MRLSGSAAIAVLGMFAAAAAGAQEQGRPLRVLGETVSPPAGFPARFVIDAVIRGGDDPFKAEVEGWLAVLGEEPAGDTVEGACVEARCALTVEAGHRKLSISADLAGKGPPGGGRLIVTDDSGGTAAEAQVRFTAISGPVPGLGEIAPPDAVRSLELADLLTWNGVSTGFSNAGDEAVGAFERSSVADWQAASGRQGAGLILVEDLAALRDAAAAAKAKVGWTPIDGPGWSLGYPAALMPVTETVGAERRFASADGALRLVVAVDPSMDEAAWDAFVERTTEDREGVERRGYTRVNDDMEIEWTEKGRAVTAAYHNREKGLVRMEFSRPESDQPADPDFAAILPRALRVDDDD